jgi:hypothetical protein
VAVAISPEATVIVLLVRDRGLVRVALGRGASVRAGRISGRASVTVARVRRSLSRMLSRVVVSVAALLVIAGCGSTRPASAVSSTCGEAYVLLAGTQTIPTDSCAGVIPSRPARVSIRRGARFSIQIGHEVSGRLDFPVPDPIGAAVRFAGRDGATANYVARALGTAQLLARHTLYCDGLDRIGSCAPFVINVSR